MALRHLAIACTLVGVLSAGIVLGGVSEAAPALHSAANSTALREIMQSAQSEQKLGSAVALVARDGKIVFEGSVGEISPGQAMTTSAIVRWSSITKPITAAAVFQLIEQHRLRLDQPVSDFFPEFSSLSVREKPSFPGQPLARPILISDLLSHQAGFSGNSDEVWALYDAPSLKTFTQKLAAIPLKTQPGTAFEYGPAYEVLAAIIEKVSGQPFDAYVERNILSPLKMKDSYFWVPPRAQPRLAAVWQVHDGKLVVYKPRGQEDSKEAGFPSGGGGLRGTIHDYFRFAEMLLNCGELDGVRILGPQSVRLMTSSHTADRYKVPGFGWGYGGRVKTGVSDHKAGGIGSFGWEGGTGTSFIIDPKAQFIGIVFAPSNPGPIQAGVDAFKDRFLAEAYHESLTVKRSARNERSSICW